jgi:hypothetical protein
VYRRVNNRVTIPPKYTLIQPVKHELFDKNMAKEKPQPSLSLDWG